jgi:hypothetical protein
VKANDQNNICLAASCLVLDRAHEDGWDGPNGAAISLNTVSKEGEVDVMRLLLHRNADINSLNAYDKTSSPSQGSD